MKREWSKKFVLAGVVVFAFIVSHVVIAWQRESCPARGSLPASSFPPEEALLKMVEANAIPAWGRRYDADCTMCHTMYPRLNPLGHEFRRLGYRMPDEFENKETHLSTDELSKFANYFSARGRARVDVRKTAGSRTDLDFEMHDVTLFYAGPVTRKVVRRRSRQTEQKILLVFKMFSPSNRCSV